MSRRAVIGILGAAAAGGGYYLYTAGGDPKVAQKEIEHDVASAKASLKGQNVSGEEAKKQGEEWAQKAGSKLDNTVNYARKEVHEADKVITEKMGKAENKFDRLKSDSATQFDNAKKETHDSIDKFDKTVEKKTAEAKSGLSSWFGLGK
ncbi:hypothetical protein ABVK25_002157 [Lepraria finkii]|uniref:Calcofluor white hypersensitive protein n=1 Tax=Lepraria finkii TaxID=1340010 RepID=A0ABR4BP68_9LECA